MRARARRDQRARRAVLSVEGEQRHGVGCECEDARDRHAGCIRPLRAPGVKAPRRAGGALSDEVRLVAVRRRHSDRGGTESRALRYGAPAMGATLLPFAPGKD